MGNDPGTNIRTHRAAWKGLDATKLVKPCWHFREANKPWKLFNQRLWQTHSPKWKGQWKHCASASPWDFHHLRLDRLLPKLLPWTHQDMEVYVMEISFPQHLTIWGLAFKSPAYKLYICKLFIHLKLQVIRYYIYMAHVISAAKMLTRVHTSKPPPFDGRREQKKCWS